MSFYAVCEEETEKRKESRGRKKEEEHPSVCSFWRISLHLYPPQSVLWQAHALKKKQVGKEGAVTRKEIQAEERERGGGRQAEQQRERAGVGNPPLHLLVIYSFMFSRRLVR